MTNEELDAIEARDRARTPGEWHSSQDGWSVWTTTALRDDSIRICEGGNGHFIAACSVDVPRLVAEVRRLKRCEDILAALESHGVDNWSGYSDALSDLDGEE